MLTLHQHWRQRGVSLSKVDYWRLKGTTPDAPPDFAHQQLPREYLPGAAGFMLTSYYPNLPMRREVWVAPNSSYAINGLTFVSDEAKAYTAR